MPQAPSYCLVTNNVVSVGPLGKKFNTVRNDHGHTQRSEFSVLEQKHHFWENFAQKIKIVCLTWYLDQFVFDQKYISWVNLVQKVSWHLAPKLIWICKTQWWCSLLPFLTENTIFGQIWSKKSKLPVWAEIWYLD